MELKHSYKSSFRLKFCLLIVPYGIETSLFDMCICCFQLLIVPYGIETTLEQYFLNLTKAFNRTLWN